MNERSKTKMLEQKTKIVDDLKTSFPDIPLFEDEIAEDEETNFMNSQYYAFVLMMGDFSPSSSGVLTQTFSIDYYSENRDDVDEMLVDIITIVDRVPTVDFIRSSKLRARAGETERFVDVVTLEFRRSVKYEC